MESGDVVTCAAAALAVTANTRTAHVTRVRALDLRRSIIQEHRTSLMVSNKLFIGWKCTVGVAVRTASRPVQNAMLSTVLLAALAAAPAAAQSPASSGRHEIFAGSELENYLRWIQSFDTASTRQWSVRPFAPAEIDDILSHKSAGPWSARFDLGGGARPTSELQIIPPTVSARFNSGFPFGSNDGPIWAGRGLTTAAQIGLFARFGPLSITLAPMVFRAENAAFAVAPATRVCSPSCGDVQYQTLVDLPQRFGNTAYQRFDPGQSTIRLDAAGAAIGISTANEWWGPAQEYPFLLGNNAPGFAHAFIGTSGPLNVYVGRLSARVIYGRLEQSAYSPVTGLEVLHDRQTQTGTSRLRERRPRHRVRAARPRPASSSAWADSSTQRLAKLRNSFKRLSAAPLRSTLQVQPSSRLGGNPTSSRPFSRVGVSAQRAGDLRRVRPRRSQLRFSRPDSGAGSLASVLTRPPQGIPRHVRLIRRSALRADEFRAPHSCEGRPRRRGDLHPQRARAGTH